MKWGEFFQIKSQPSASLLAPMLAPSYESLLSSTSFGAGLLTVFQQGFSGHPTWSLFQPFAQPSLSQTAVAKQGTTFLVCRVTWDKTGHTCWISPRKGLQKTDRRVHVRAGPNGGTHLLALALCLSLSHNSWANLPQSAGRRTCLLPASGTAGKRVGERLKCYMWKGKWSPLPWEVTCWGVTLQVWRLTGLLLPAELSMKSVQWYHLRRTVTVAKSHNEDMVIATSQVKVASHSDFLGHWKKLCWPKCSLAKISTSYAFILSWQSTCFIFHVRLHAWPLMNLLFLSCV